MNLNKLMLVGALAATTLVTGCASTGGSPVAGWQANRFMAEEIKAAKQTNTTGKVELKDVTYISKQGPKFAVIGVPFSSLGVVCAGIYTPVVNGVDQKSIMESGREAAIALNNAIKNEGKTKEQVFEEWAKNDKSGAKARKEVYDEYMKYVANVNNDDTLKEVNDIIGRQIPEAMQKVSATLQQTINDVQSGKVKLDNVSKMELLGALGTVKDDAAALGSELKDAGVGAKLWLDILQDENRMKGEMSAAANMK